MLNSPFRRLALLLLASLALSPAVPARQGGYTEEKHPELGMSFPRAKDYEAIPVQPTEEWVVLQFAEKLSKRDEDDRGPRPELRVVWIDWVDEPEGAEVTSTGSDEGKRKRDEERDGPPPPINTIGRYVDQELPAWRLGDPEVVGAKDGYDRFVYELRLRSGKSGASGWAYAWKNDEHTIAMIGWCGTDAFAKQEKIWDRMASKMRFSEPEQAGASKWERFYERRTKFNGPEYRVKIRDGLVDGWEADDTENFIFIYSTRDQALIRSLKRELEAIREAYIEIFPPSGPITAVSAVRVCKDRDEYIQYGGPPSSGGYWYDKAEELVFYDYEDVDNERGSGKANSKIVLYHEAFHQYIFYSVGELAPHSWFNEGYGDFFSGARFDGSGRVTKIDVNPWRIEMIQMAIERGVSVPWEDIVSYEQRQYYANAAICYAQGWSMIYFLRTSKDAQKREEWAAILPIYFDTLKAHWFEARAKLEADGDLEDEAKLERARREAREAAVKAAFSDVDFLEIEDAWKEYTLSLKVP